MVMSFEGPAITSSLGRNQVSQGVQKLLPQPGRICMSHGHLFQYPNS
jgi:hypothetical protein